MSKNSKRIPAAGKLNKPDPTSVHFLFENPRFINEPVCHASTSIVKEKQHQWWPSEIPREVKLKPKYALGSTMRHDYRELRNMPEGQTRFGSNPNRLSMATGIVPVIALDDPNTNKERISYQHMFDCRRDRRERGKLYGSFVWEKADQNNRSQSSRLRLEKADTVADTSERALISRSAPTNTQQQNSTQKDRRTPSHSTVRPFIPQSVEQKSVVANGSITDMKSQTVPSLSGKATEKPITTPPHLG